MRRFCRSNLIYDFHVIAETLLGAESKRKTNGLIRYYIPKSTDFSKLTEKCLLRSNGN